MPAVLALLMVLGGAPEARGVVDPPTLAVTIDDLPWRAGDPRPLAEKRVDFDHILAALGRRGVRAVGFVNGDRIEPAQRAWLDAWVAAGHALGNHTASHPDLNAVTAEAFLDDVVRGERALQAWPAAPRYFRFPYLQRGETAVKRDAVAAGLKALGLVTAPVTIVLHDWRYDRRYVQARIDGRPGEAARAVRDYERHVHARTALFQRMALSRVGRPVRHVLLVHANALNGDHLDTLLARYGRDGWVFVPLADALADPVYAQPDRVATRDGLSWLKRIGPR